MSALGFARELARAVRLIAEAPQPVSRDGPWYSSLPVASVSVQRVLPSGRRPAGSRCRCPSEAPTRATGLVARCGLTRRFSLTGFAGS